tara:strand:+ start:803 stop:1606 length:804 start_codon:yes stop_codon:yes gene_type:complete
MKYDAFIFDVDGVLIDTSKSFAQAVLHAVRVGAGSKDFTINELNLLKSVGGFNNDWFAAMAGAAWVSYGSQYPFEEFTRRSREIAIGIEGVRGFLPQVNTSFEESIQALVMEAYGGITACKKLYGFKPKTIQIPGYWQTEKALIPKSFFNQIKERMGIVTGRNQQEMNLAFEILDWQLPDPFVAISDDSELDKPNPEKLIKIVNRMGWQNPIFFGDTRDDMNLVKNYKKETKCKMDFCSIESDLDLPDYGFKTKTVTNFFKELEING